MATENDLLIELNDIFPKNGTVVPDVEMRFRFFAKYGDLLDATLNKLMDMGVLTRFEFRNNVNYKSKDDIPTKFDNSKKNGNGKAQLDELFNIVSKLADKTGDPQINEMIKNYINKYN